MNESLWRRTSGPAFPVLSTILAAVCLAGPAAAGSSPAAPVGWLQLDSDCAARSRQAAGPADDRQVLPCGGAGTFVFDRTGLPDDGGCAPLASGFEPPELFPVDPAPPLPANFPCAQGSCLGHAPGKPWVALVDWPTTHGWSVAATVREASDRQVQVQLYDITNAGVFSTWVAPVSDLHVLVQLCSLAQAAEDHPEDRPLAVNMSFGRLDTQTAGCPPDSSSPLSCAIDSVLSHLAADGIVPVAAAGNHQQMLFPASSPSAISVGALDLSYLQQSRKARASMQTPAAAEALMLGYGLYLSAGGGLAGGGGDTDWPAPPGSSYAAALLTGWLGGTLATGHPLPSLLNGSRWSPLTTPAGLALALNGTPLPGSELLGPQRLLDRALHKAAAITDPQPGATLALEGAAPPLPENSFLLADNGNGPQPGIDPCVPCRGNGLSGLFGADKGILLVDLAASGGLPPQITLVALLLRVGGDVYRFDRSRDPDLLAAFAAGQLGSLTLTGLGDILKPGQQPSLVLVVNAGGTAYWHEVPMHLPQ